MNCVQTFYYIVFFVLCLLSEKVFSSSDENILEDLPYTVCRPPDSTMFLRVQYLGHKCEEMALPDYSIQKNATIEEFRNRFSYLCQRQSLFRNCNAETTVNLTVCDDEPFLKSFKIYREVMEKILEIGCSENGERFASVMHGLEDYRRSKVVSKKCTTRYEQTCEDLIRNDIDVSSKLFNLFNEIKILAECFHHEELTDAFKVDVKFFLEAIINTMKCVNPQGGELVPCGTIDASSITTPNICDVRTFGTNMTLYDVLEKDSTSCDFNFLRHFDLVREEEEIRQDLSNACGYYVDLPYCYKQAMIVSEVCLNNTEQNQFKLLGDFIKGAHRTVCSDGDKRLGDILTEIYRHKSPGEDIFVWDCVDMTKSTRNVTDEHRNSSKNMRFYHEVEAFKECLVNKLQGHQPSIDAVTSLTNDLMKKVKCVNPEDGTTVLCETLHNTA